MNPTGTSLIRLLTWLSPAFPTGGFAYSHGLEWAIEAGDVTDRASLVAWLSDLIAHGSLWTDAILLRHACRADDHPALADFAYACAASRERAEEMRAQGAAFGRAVAVWQPDAPAAWPLSVALGHALRREGIDEDAGCLAALHASAAAMVSAAVRLVPLGQTDGLRALAALEPVLAQAARASRDATLDDVGGMCLRSDIAAMRHETQATRLFRT
ncbi:urease accessory protein UreF [Lichenicoccus sp.]|uniref:urease accessory protein UreF n=1 Tax=Lichenicoccus sp. TaxID=2781899 RepID=UPI003D0C28FC